MDRKMTRSRRVVEQFNLENALTHKVSSSVRLHSSPSGKTLIANKEIDKGELLAVYTGRRSTEPPEEDDFVYGIVHQKKHIWINAQDEDNVAKFMRSDRKRCNTRVKKILLQGAPYPVFYSATSIPKDHEILAWFGATGLESTPRKVCSSKASEENYVEEDLSTPPHRTLPDQQHPEEGKAHTSAGSSKRKRLESTPRKVCSSKASEENYVEEDLSTPPHRTLPDQQHPEEGKAHTSAGSSKRKRLESTPRKVCASKASEENYVEEDLSTPPHRTLPDQQHPEEGKAHTSAGSSKRKRLESTPRKVCSSKASEENYVEEDLSTPPHRTLPDQQHPEEGKAHTSAGSSKRKRLESTPRKVCSSKASEENYVEEDLSTPPHRTLPDQQHPEEGKAHTSAGSSKRKRLESTPRKVCSSKASEENYVEEDLSTPPQRTLPDQQHPEEGKAHTSAGSSKRKPRRPSRPCVFCKKFNSRLPRHYETMHADEDEIVRIKKMTPNKRAQEYSALRIRGMYLYNLDQLGRKSPRLLTERKLSPSKKIVSCVICQKFVQAKTFYAHSCTRNKSRHAGLSVECLTTDENTKRFHAEILEPMRSDAVGEFAKSDETIKLFGIRLFRKVKNLEKKTEQRHAVMAHMRKLTKIYFQFRSAAALAGKDLEVIDMFYSRNYTYLEAAFEGIGGDIFGPKRSNARLEHCSTFLRAIKKLKAVFFIRQETEKVEALTSFGDFFKSERSDLFGEDEEVIFKQREVKLRQPKNLPLEEVIGKLRNHCVTRTQEVMRIKGNNKEKYLELRRLVVCRLTFLNGRRGGEPARLLREQVQMAIDGVWLAGADYDRVRAMNTRYKELLDNYMLAYQTGKRNSSWVPVLIPRSSLSAIKYLMDDRNRLAAGIYEKNPFLFAMTASSESHAVGSSEARHVCNEIGIPVELTATGNRHRVSTLFATKDVSASDRDIFFQHMGHSSKINRDVYQAPSIQNVLVSGDHLDSMDKFGSETWTPSTSGQAKRIESGEKIGKSTSQVFVKYPDYDVSSEDDIDSDDDSSTALDLVDQRKEKTSSQLPRSNRQGQQIKTAMSKRAKTTEAPINTVQSASRQLFAKASNENTSTDASCASVSHKPKILPDLNRHETQTATNIDELQGSTCSSSGASDATNSDTTSNGSSILSRERKSAPVRGKGPRAPCIKQNELKRRIKWTRQDNEAIEAKFKKFIQTRGEGGKGQLPDKSLIDDFWKTEKIEAVARHTPRKKYKAIRTQIYNLRNLYRKRLEKRLTAISVKP